MRLPLILSSALVFAMTGCSTPQSGPDKSAAGGILGAGWGAGTGAIIGNQVATSGQGAAVGAGMGLVAGAIGGAGYDVTEGAMLEQERELAALRISNEANARELGALQDKFDRAAAADIAGAVFQTFFDVAATSLRSGAIANLEAIADGIKRSPRVKKVKVVGHADDSGTKEYNERIAEARARTVASYLQNRGIASDQIEVTSFGSKRPLVANSSAESRQLNRRVDIIIGG